MGYKDRERQREYQRKWIAKRRAEWFDGKSCAACGETDDLQLDHIDPDEKVSHRIWSLSKVKREAELAKCQVLCQDCHQEKTLLQVSQEAREGRPLHGDPDGYRFRKGCHCLDCDELRFELRNLDARDYR